MDKIFILVKNLMLEHNIQLRMFQGYIFLEM